MILRQLPDHAHKIVGVGQFGNIHDNAVKIVVFVVVRTVVMRGARVHVVLGCGFQSQKDARINRALGHLDHGDRARGLGGDDGAGACNPFGACKVGLGQQNDVGARNLIFEHFGQRCFMVKAVVRQTLRVDRGDIGRETPGCHRFGVGQRDHPVHRDPRADVRPVERLEQRLGQCQTRGFNQDVIRTRVQRHQRFDGRNKVIRHGAADAAVCQFENILGRAFGNCTLLQNFAVDTDIAKFVHDDGQPPPARIQHKLAHQRGFARSQKTGDDSDGEFCEIRHGAPPGAEFGQHNCV